jgi:hypothetical protein
VVPVIVDKNRCVIAFFDIYARNCVGGGKAIRRHPRD